MQRRLRFFNLKNFHFNKKVWDAIKIRSIQNMYNIWYSVPSNTNGSLLIKLFILVLQRTIANFIDVSGGMTNHYLERDYIDREYQRSCVKWFCSEVVNNSIYKVAKASNQ